MTRGTRTKVRAQYRPVPKQWGSTPRTRSVIERRLGETWWRTREGQSAQFIASCLKVSSRSVVRYREELRRRGELPPDAPVVKQEKLYVHLAIWQQFGGRGNQRSVIACGALDIPHGRRTWGRVRTVTCPACLRYRQEHESADDLGQ